MSQSTNAILAYGKNLSNLNLEGEDFDEFNVRLCRDYGCEIVVHCSDSHPMYFLAIAQGFGKPIGAILYKSHRKT